MSDRGLRVNENIRAREVRVIDENGEQLGVMIPREALRIARERGLDLVEVAPNARPPVCRVMDYGKYMYEKSKKERESRKNQKTVKIKEVRISPKIDDHDFSVRVKNAVGFLQKGNKVKATVRFRG
ncbi:MAG: translation initiation factor IF-3, partial [Bacillota bacterium]